MLALLINALLLAVATQDSKRLPRAVVINLPRHVKRLNAVRDEFQGAGLRFERMPAVDGRMLAPDEMKANVTALGRHLLTPGMIGCFLSHRRCWAECAASGEPLMVFEDDAVLMPEFRSRLAAALNDLPVDWDVLLLGAFGCVHPSGVYGPYGIFKLFGWVGGGTRKTRKLPGDGGLHVPWRPYGTHAYLLSPSGARKLLETCPRANYHVDNVAWGVRRPFLFLSMQTGQCTGACFGPRLPRTPGKVHLDLAYAL